ncbi:MAG: hypothetical protein K2P84_10005 [Undibacterium sp.]|nr:hypothetical protein [Undibacterium sp.]
MRVYYFLLVLILHLLGLYFALRQLPSHRIFSNKTMQVALLLAPTKNLPALEAIKQKAKVTPQKTASIRAFVSPSRPENKLENKPVPSSITETLSSHDTPIKRDIKSLTMDLEANIKRENQTLSAARAPNTILRERLATEQKIHAEENASVVGESGSGSYNLADGSRITKVNGKCYKAPDPGREYLHQPPVRRVFCTR